MKDYSAIRTRYLRDPLPIRMGGLAADLARVASFSRNPANLHPVSDLLREAAHFIEWTAPGSSFEAQLALLTLQRQLICWHRQLTEQFSEPEWRSQMGAEAQSWSQQVLSMSGLTPPR